jgi:integrase/recombinase XerD
VRERDPNHHLYTVGNTYYLKVEIGGRQLRESLRTADVGEARARRDERIEELKGQTHAWPVAVGRWLTEYLPENVDASTAKRYASSIRQLGAVQVTHRERKVALADLPIEVIRIRTIGEIVAWSKRHRRDNTNATRRRDLTALSNLLHACIGWSWREDNPARQWDRSHIKERREPIILPPDRHVDAYLGHCPPSWARAARFLDLTGLRTAEGFGLLWDEIKADGNAIELTNTKRSRARYITLDPAAVGILAGTPRHIRSPYVFWHDDGEPYRNVSSRHVQLRSKPAVTREAGGPVQFTLHHLRHRFAVRALRGGMNIYNLQLYLGHTSVKTTEIYLDYLDPETRQRAMRVANGPA